MPGKTTTTRRRIRRVATWMGSAFMRRRVASTTFSAAAARGSTATIDRKSTRLNSSHTVIYTPSLHDALPISKHARWAGHRLLAREGIGQSRPELRCLAKLRLHVGE